MKSKTLVHFVSTASANSLNNRDINEFWPFIENSKPKGVDEKVTKHWLPMAS